MAKANSPIRLEQALMEQAKLAGSLQNRSASEQIEYWASIGRHVARVLDPETMIRINSGLAKIRVESIESGPVDADSVFANLDAQRASGELAAQVTTTPFKYRASKEYEGYLERIDQNGNTVIGQFKNGKFIKKIAKESA
ncbi:MAG: hypothetical protein R3183_04320 [Oleiphilaceae bacterium]|nr:hypothetical protein [Oleiphilaceae bacterium]